MQKSSIVANDDDMMYFEYYTRPFIFLGESLHKHGYDFNESVKENLTFWSLLPEGEYSNLQSCDYLNAYRATLEHQIKKLVEPRSRIFWLHAYRRISPRLPGLSEEPDTILNVRRTVESAFAKYAESGICSGIGQSHNCNVEEVFNGLLLADDFELEREVIEKGPNQLVLLDFGEDEYRTIYEIEKYAHEIWRTSAMQRIFAKGANLVVSSSPPYYFDNRSEELDGLVKSFDSRSGKFDATATGTAFSKGSSRAGYMAPTYNVSGIEFPKELLKITKTDPGDMPPFQPNFFWLPFNLSDYRRAHSFYSSQFELKHKVCLDAVYLVLQILFDSVFERWVTDENVGFLFSIWKRAYIVLPHLESFDILIERFQHSAQQELQIENAITKEEIDIAVSFLSRFEDKQGLIDIAFPTTFNIFNHIDGESVFIDFAWIYEVLYYLFFGLRFKGEDVKGEILESVMEEVDAPLPTVPCIGKDKTSKQIDYSSGHGKILLIGECKAVGKAIDFSKGSKKTIDFRTKKVVDRAIREIDEKAEWLHSHPVGTNYDITDFEYILPIGISPFVEYIPSRKFSYWINDETPRILSISEVKELKDSISLEFCKYNLIKL